jgi:hypothetical protein
MSSPSSYSLIVRDAMLTRVQAMPAFRDFKFNTNKALQIQPEHLPCFSLYWMNDNLTADGDADAAEPRFHVFALYGFSIVIQNNDAAAAENTLDNLWSLMMDRLMRDPSLYLNPAAQIQSYSPGNRTHQFGSIGADNSIPVGECRFTLTCDLGVIDYPPIVDAVLSKIHVTTQYPPGASTDVQRVEVEYDLPTEKEPSQ